MNHLRRFCAMLTLLSAQTLTARAGDVSCGAAVQPCRTTAAADELVVGGAPEWGTTDGLFLESVLSLLRGALSVF